jgi:hypothetical protein
VKDIAQNVAQNVAQTIFCHNQYIHNLPRKKVPKRLGYFYKNAQKEYITQ